ncbi:hypothetical protein JHK82_022557 [Glycine max]|nr:hypothetical protein JHK86_022574 [Glycine max]KAG5137826.1 hypothetical protein JHK82_022557 [Glycine max]
MESLPPLLSYDAAGFGLVGEDDALGSSGAVATRIESSYMINLHDLDMRHVKYFTFVHGELKRILIYIILSLKYKPSLANMSAPIGGILVISANTIHYHSQVLETTDLLSEVTKSVDYYVQGKTLAGGNLFGR